MKKSRKYPRLLISEILNMKHWDDFTLALQKYGVANINHPEIRDQNDLQKVVIESKTDQVNDERQRDRDHRKPGEWSEFME